LIGSKLRFAVDGQLITRVVPLTVRLKLQTEVYRIDSNRKLAIEH